MATSNLHQNRADLKELETKIDDAAAASGLSLSDIRELQKSVSSDEDDSEFEDFDPLFLFLGSKPKPVVRHNWETFILWNPTIRDELNFHRAYNNQLYGKLSLGKLLTKDLLLQVGAGERFDWHKEFILLNVTKCGNENVRIHKDGSVTISVVETATEINCDVPVSERTRALVVSKECSKIALEIVRCLPATVMIWGAEVIMKDDVYVLLDVLHGPVSVLIFHEEEISADRISTIQRNISQSELSDFAQDCSHYIYKCDDTKTFAVYATGTTGTKLVEGNNNGTLSSCTRANITDENAEDDEFFEMEDDQNEGSEEEECYFEIVDDEDEEKTKNTIT